MIDQRSSGRLSVSAVVLNYRRTAGVTQVLKRIVDSSRIIQDIVVVDNSDLDHANQDLIDVCLQAGATYLRADFNGGYARGMNLGINATQPTDLILLLTHDCLLEPSAIQALAEAAELDPSIGAVGPVLFNGQSHELFSAGGQLDYRSGIASHQRDIPGTRSIVDWLDGACLLLRRSALRERPFLEGFFLYYEDVEICTDLRKRGYGVALVPSARATQTTGGIPTYFSVRNRILFSRLHLGRRALVFSLVSPIRMILKKSLKIALGRGQGTTLAVGDTVKGLCSGAFMTGFRR